MLSSALRVLGSPARLTLFGRAVQYLSQFALVLLVPKALSPAAYLEFNLVLPLALLASSLAFGWLRSAIHRHVYELLDPANAAVRETVVAYYGFVSVALAGIFLAVTAATDSLYSLIPLLLVATALKNGALAVLNAGQKHRGFLLANIGFAVALGAFLGLCFLGGDGMLPRALTTYAVLDILVAVAAWLVMGVHPGRHLPRPHGDVAARYFKYGAPLVMNVMATWVISLSDRYLLNLWEAKEPVAGYVLSYQLAASVITVPMSFFMVIMFPRVLKIDKDSGQAAALAYTERLFRQYRRHVATLAIAGCAVVLPFRYFAYPDYVFDPWIVVVIVAAHVVSGFSHFVNKEFELNGRTMVITRGVAAGAVTNVALNLALIPLMGTMGAAIATLVAYSTAVYLVHRERGRMPGVS